MKPFTALLITILAASSNLACAQLSEESCANKAQTYLQHFFQSKGRIQQSKESTEQLISWSNAYPDNPSITFTTAIYLAGANKTQEALPYMKLAYDTSNHDPIIGTQYAQCLKMNTRPADAIAVLREMRQEQPSNFAVKFTLGKHLELTQQYDEALQIFTEARDVTLEIYKQRGVDIPKPCPDLATINMCIGTCYLYQGEHEQAILTLNKAESYWPGAGGIITFLGEAYLKDEQPQKAKEQFLKVMSDSKRSPASLYFLSLIEKKGNPQQAKEYLERAYSMRTRRLEHSDNGMEFYIMYMVARDLGKTTDARELKAEATKLMFTYEAPWKNNQNKAIEVTK